jgi:arylformamidase
MSLHTGTHADAPFHVQSEGRSMDSLDLSLFIGPAIVVEVKQANPIPAELISQYLDADIPRVLFKTRAATTGEGMPRAGFFSKAAARVLAARGVRLIGIDTPSVDAVDSETLEAHRVFAGAGIAILENLLLDDVPPGRYELIALPLRLAGMDASPVRAILRTTD